MGFVSLDGSNITSTLRHKKKKRAVKAKYISTKKTLLSSPEELLRKYRYRAKQGWKKKDIGSNWEDRFILDYDTIHGIDRRVTKKTTRKYDEALCHAYGCSLKNLHRTIYRARNRMNVEKDVREKGCIIDNEHLASQYWTAENAYCWEIRCELKTGEQPPTRKQLSDNFKQLTQQQRNKYQRLAETQLNKFPRIRDTLVYNLWERNGQMSWDELSKSVDGWVSKNTIRKYFMSQRGFQYVKQKFIPLLTPAQVTKRLSFVNAENDFWQKAKDTGMKVLEVHLDEKWFFGSVNRKNLKQVPGFGIEVKHVKVHHKGYQNKVMFVAVVAAASIGGYAHGACGMPLIIKRCCVREKANRDSYKRHIDADGNISFPKNGPNAVLSRKKGQIYAFDVELKGDSVGTAAKPKFSLKKMWVDDILPLLDEITGPGGPLEGFKVKFQEDGAGPHNKKSYVEFLKAELEQRGWYYTPQPPNSPLTNVLDLLVFPALSKRVSKNRMQFGMGHVRQMSKDEIEQVVLEEFYKFPPEMIARAFITQKHVVSMIKKYHGYNDYIKNRSELHNSVRNKFKARGGNSVSPHELFETLSYGGRLTSFFRDKKN